MTATRRAMLRAFAVLALALPAILTCWANAGAADAQRVVIKDFAFAPKTLTVAAGTTVTWVNRDDDAHQIVGKSGAFRSPALDTNESFSFTFKEAGTYEYFCSLHPQMTGTITVQ